MSFTRFDSNGTHRKRKKTHQLNRPSIGLSVLSINLIRRSCTIFVLVTRITWYQNCDIRKWENHIIARKYCNCLASHSGIMLKDIRIQIVCVCVCMLLSSHKPRLRVGLNAMIFGCRIHHQPKLVSFLPFQFGLQINWQHKNTAFKIIIQCVAGAHRSQIWDSRRAKGA